MARRRGSSFVRGQRRATDWSASSVSTAFAAVAASSAVLLETFTPVVGGETVIRTRGLFAIVSDQQGANESQIGAVGIAVVTAQAVSVGITAIPHPDTDAAWGGWFWHSYFKDQTFFRSSVGITFGPQMVRQIVIDSKAMRKVDEDERVVVVVENSGAFGIQVDNSERFLSKLH